MAPLTLSTTNTGRRRSIKGTRSLQSLVLREISSILDISSEVIDLNAGFVELGGHSLSAIYLASTCKSLNIHLSVEDILLSETIADVLDSAKWTANSPTTEAVPFTTISPAGRALKRTAEPTSGPLTKRHHTSSQRRESSDSLTTLIQSPMTEMQLAFIQGSQANPGTNTISFYETYQTKHVSVMKKAWKAVIESESIFRTRFEVTEDQATLIEQEYAEFAWEEIVVRNQEEYANALEDDQLFQEVFTSFKVVTWPKDGQDTTLTTIIWRVHHALIDGFSAALVCKKVRWAAAGRPVRAGTPFTQLAKGLYALQNVERSACQQFWRQRQNTSSNAAGDLRLPAPTSTDKLSKNAMQSIRVSIQADQLSECAQKAKVSAVSMHYAAWAMVLSKYSDSDTVVFGVVLTGRNLPIAGVDDGIGPLINTLPLHVCLDRTKTMAEYMRQIFRSLVELGSVQYSRQEDVVGRDFSSALTNEFDMEALEMEGVRPVGKSYFTAVTDIPLSIFIGSDNTVRICYHCRSFNKADIERLGEYYQSALHGLTATEISVGSCMDKMLSGKTRSLSRKFGNCLSESTRASSVHDDLVTLFERAASEYPLSIAVEKASERLTYSELNVKADRVSKNLSQFIKPGDVVCVNADRSVNWIIAIYGILKAGGTYSPQDKALPAIVRDTNFQSAAAKVFLVSSSSDRNLKPTSCDVCLVLDEVLANPCVVRSAVSFRESSTPSANAYICFTSGSSGKPKGVICTHEGLVAFQRTLEVRLFAGPTRRISQIMAPAFDGSIHEIFSALSYGATLVLPDSIDPVSHLRLVDSALLTPSLAQKLTPSDYPKLKTVSYSFLQDSHIY